MRSTSAARLAMCRRVSDNRAPWMPGPPTYSADGLRMPGPAGRVGAGLMANLEACAVSVRAALHGIARIKDGWMTTAEVYELEPGLKTAFRSGQSAPASLAPPAPRPPDSGATGPETPSGESPES